ncbi:MAG: hypothetical protein RQ826_17185 [Xanthomonadales bacterium]|nr:hypothetical protein [Xanthomonadales bacterium]
MTIAAITAEWEHIALWGLAATVTMTVVLQGSQSAGLTRLSLSFLLGTMITGRRSRASVVGFLAYMLGGWLFAGFYFLLMFHLDIQTWWLGAILGLIHALFLLVAVLPILPYFHPRMASEYEGPSELRRLEPPGFMGLNYGYRTPLTTLAGHMLYGAILGVAYGLI